MQSWSYVTLEAEVDVVGGREMLESWTAKPDSLAGCRGEDKCKVLRKTAFQDHAAPFMSTRSRSIGILQDIRLWWRGCELISAYLVVRAMAIRRARIDRQLAVIATARRPVLPAENLILKILLRSWSRTTRRVSEARARERAWRAVRNERLLRNAVAAWHNWVQENHANEAEWAARVIMIKQRRYKLATL